jgi:CHAD domain-containing protein
MAVAKWFSKLNAVTPSLDAARMVLESRARAVTHYLMLLVNRRNEQPEQIHQLRVATRRLGAALTIFQDFVRTRDYRILRHLTRHVRRAAGAARDLDVQRAIIATRLRALEPAGAGLATLCDVALRRQRQVTQQRLLQLARAAASDFSEAVQRGLDRLKPLPSHDKSNRQTLGGLARKTLRRRLRDLRAAQQKDLQDLDNLHQLRIAAKRLRYAMEVFSGCFPIQFRREQYRVVERIQEELGRINDLRNLIRTMQALQMELRSLKRDRTGVAPEALQDFQSRVQIELKMYQTRFLRRWSAAGQRRFHRRLKKMVNRPSKRTGLRGARISRL